MRTEEIAHAENLVCEVRLFFGGVMKNGKEYHKWVLKSDSKIKVQGKQDCASCQLNDCLDLHQARIKIGKDLATS